MNSRFGRYIMAVLKYYRSEWTDVSDQDCEYRLVLTKDLREILWSCTLKRMSVPNAAKEVQIFLSTTAQDCRVCKERLDDDAAPQGESGTQAPKPE